MSKVKKSSIEKILMAIFLVLQGAAFFAVWELFLNHELKKAYLIKGNLLVVLLYMAMMFFVCKSLDGLRISVNSHYALIVSHFISAFITDIMILVLLIFIFRGFSFVFMAERILLLFAVNCVVSVIWILAGKLIIRKCSARKCVLFYYNDDPEYLKQKFEEKPDQFKILKIVKVNGLEDIDSESFEGIDSAIIAYMPSEFRNEILKICFRKDIEVVISPRVSDVLLRGATELNILDRPLLVLETANSSTVQKAIKRAFDIVFSGFALIVASPVFLITALAIKIEDHGPVFYKQKRCTIGGREFEIYKFRSMIVNAEKNNKAVLASKGDSRITKVGNFIRATRIDELPQLINIIKGDMSVVGPRPERKELIDQYTDVVEAFPYRMKVKAGLTGYAQLLGKYNSNPYNKLLFDLMYVQKFSIILDLRLILLTLKIVFMKESTEGVDEEFEIFMETFNKTKEKNS